MTTSRLLPVQSPSVWHGSELADPTQWTTVPNETQRRALADAARAAARNGWTATTLRRERFPLPELAQLLSEWTTALTRGRAFVLIRRFPTTC